MADSNIDQVGGNHATRSQPLEWGDQTREVVIEVVQRVARDVGEEYKHVPLPAVEKSTRSVFENHDLVETIKIGELLDIIGEIAESHPYIEVEPVNDDTPEAVTRRVGEEALVEFCKREALHEVRRIEFQTDQLAKSLESRIYW